MTARASSVAVADDSLAVQTSLYRRFLVALDSSDHANAAMLSALALAELTENPTIVGAHAYAAQLHDVRFRQMEGGLPEQFREEQELERQRDVHDDLITRGLSIITDCYLDQAERDCRKADITFIRSSLEGKNYRVLTEETNSGSHELLVMGSLGLGAVEGSCLGTVCQRVARRSNIDTLIIKNPEQSIQDGPIVAAIDGSAKSYGGLVTAMSLARAWNVELKVISAFDPYFHYVAFNRIADVLSDEAGKVFRFKEQEKLHEEIIDSGLATIYQGHLDVAETIAEDMDVRIETVLLDGKPHDAIEKYVLQVKPSLLIIGKLGIHADTGLDIGGNAENLLQHVDCAVLLSQREFTPKLDVIADVTTSWTTQAEQAMTAVPDFARNMARMAILRYAQQEGHTVITESIVKQATMKLCPMATDAISQIVAASDAGEFDVATSDKAQEKGFAQIRWSVDAATLLASVANPSVRENIKHRSEKKARADKADEVRIAHIKAFLTEADAEEQATASSNGPLHWQAMALARLMRVPEGFMRDSCHQQIETYARAHGLADISLETAEAGLAASRQKMSQMMPPMHSSHTQPPNMQSKQSSESSAEKKSKCPFAAMGTMASGTSSSDEKNVKSESKFQTESDTIPWSTDAELRLRALPEGISRDMTRKAVSTIGAQRGLAAITQAYLEEVLSVFQSGSMQVSESMPWDADAREGINRAPDMVRGMLTKEIEGWAERQGLDRVNVDAVDKVKQTWADRGAFHLDPDDPRNSQ
ncbi:MAG: universal stress protein [Mariprofundus sp.]|nr:universal stress protein [Mariprofundus sp.]